MKLAEMTQAVYDFWRPNRYGLKPYLLNDGQKHPFAVICPGGGYGMVCSFVEGLPFAKELNAKGYHPLTEEQKVRNREKSKIRVRIEHIFGYMTMSLRGLTVRSIGILRAKFNAGLTNLTYNFCRYEILSRTTACVG